MMYSIKRKTWSNVNVISKQLTEAMLRSPNINNSVAKVNGVQLFSIPYSPREYLCLGIAGQSSKL